MRSGCFFDSIVVACGVSSDLEVFWWPFRNSILCEEDHRHAYPQLSRVPRGFSGVEVGAMRSVCFFDSIVVACGVSSDLEVFLWSFKSSVLCEEDHRHAHP